MFSLLTPMPGLPWYLLPIWPLIFWRIQRLKKWFRAAGGPGSQMLWGVMWNGRIVVLQLSDDLSGHRSGIFRAPVSNRLGRVLSGEDPLSPLGRKPGPRAIRAGLEALGPGFRREERELGVIPDT
ncbi:hypothetical protein [Hyphomonas sp.]|uniref:hypothetical protein n=1 Tax=Hyphomonas sp. TaxID=87 RepID=UPI0030F861F7